MTRGRRLFVVVYTLSGAAGLVYEVTWTRLLALQLGHTVAAASTVLAAFMGGLAAGAAVAGSLRPRSRTASLRLYAALEIAVALLALVLPFALRASLPALAWAYADGNAAARLGFVRVVISLIVVGIPAAAMGATFPVAVMASNRAAVLYAANTAGAACGAVVAGFWLIPALGLRGTTWIGVGLNAAAAGGAWWISRQEETAEIAETAKKPEFKKTKKEPLRVPRPQRFLPQPSPKLASFAAAVSGFSALVYEVVWTRLLAMVIGPTTYAFATMAASFISGLAIGSAVGSRIARQTLRPARWLGALLALGGVAAVVSAWYGATALPLVVAVQVADPAADFAGVVWRQAILVALLVLPMTLALGASFPLALALARTGDADAAREAARVYTANTVGAIAGALAAGFALVPALGLRDSIRLATLLAAAAGTVVLAVDDSGLPPGGRKRWLFGGRLQAILYMLVALLVNVFTPAWDSALLASGAYKYAAYLSGTDLDGVLRAGTLAYYKEGPSGTVSVRDLTGTRSLAIDGKVDASNGGDMLTQRMLGLLPVLMHGSARDVAVIGLGSGVTAAAALDAGTTQRMDVLEISPEVVEASRFFEKENGRVLERPGVRLIVGDGRSHLLLTSRRYDVIVSEPSNPWMAGVASLFTREFFEAARATLKPNGLLCQWAHTYDISTSDLRSIVRTFATVFPEGSLWLVGGGDLLLIGTRDGAIAPRLDALQAAGQTAALADVGVAPGTAPFALLTQFAGGPRELTAFAGDALIQTDDRTALEYSAPRGIYGRSGDDNAAAIRALKAEPPPAVRSAFAAANDRDWTSRGLMDMRAQAFPTAYEAFHEAVSRNSRNHEALSGLSDAAGGSGRLNDERSWLHEIARREPGNPEVRIELSRVLAVTGDAAGAIRAAQEALELAPSDARAAEQLASVLADTGDADRLSPFADAMVQRFPDRPEPRFYRATALFMRGKTEDAVTAVRQVVDAHPDHARAQALLGTACATLGRRDCAQAAFAASIRGNPRDPSGYINAGAFSLQNADSSAAAGYFASALAIDPSSAAARNGLAQARALHSAR